MAGQNEHDDDEFDNEADVSSLVRDLRKQLKAASKERDDAIAERDGLKGTVRERTVADVLTAKGVRPGIAKYVPSDVQSEEDVLGWLKDNAEDFGITLDAKSEGDKTDPAAQAAAARDRELQDRSVTPQAISDLQKLLEGAESPEQTEALLEQALSLTLS